MVRASRSLVSCRRAAESAAGCCEASLAAGAPQQAADTAAATLSMLSCLAFGSAASAAPYAAVGTRCKQALKAAFDAGVALKEEVRVVLCHPVCGRRDMQTQQVLAAQRGSQVS